MNIEEIGKINRIQFKKLSKIKSEEAAFNNLIQKQETGSMGGNLLYSRKLEMANYLCPNNNISLERFGQYLKKSKNGFHIVFKNVISKWPNVF